MKSRVFGFINGEEVVKYTLTNGRIEADILNYGGTITAIRVPDVHGKMTDVVLGYETLDQYIAGKAYLGALIGRYGNRIEKATFVLNGEQYKVGCNEGPNSLHGGIQGFDRKIWKVLPEGDDKLTLSYLSPHGEEGFPGNLQVTVTYAVTPEDGLSIEYRAVSDRDTVINLTNHAYFNVNGTENATDGIELWINADQITPTDAALIPHNTFKSVEGTLYDFRTGHPFVWDLTSDPVLGKRGCYDDNFVLNGTGMRKVSYIRSGKTGITMEVITDQPGMQIYTGNKKGIALETQNFPNAMNCPAYPSPILRAGENYHTITIYRFHT